MTADPTAELIDGGPPADTKPPTAPATAPATGPAPEPAAAPGTAPAAAPGTAPAAALGTAPAAGPTTEPATERATAPATGPATGSAAGRSLRAGWERRRSDPAWLLLPLRLFLGFTFAYAGVDKMSDRAFFDPAEPTSIAAQIAAFRTTSPIRPLLGIAAAHPTAVGVLIALGETAVGVATLLGVRVRLAALGGALIALSLLLTVTWQTRPYYYGSDIVFLVAWLPLVGYGSGDVLSLQRFTERRWARPDRPTGGRRALLTQLGVAAGATLITAVAARLLRGGPTRLAVAAEPTPGEPGSTPAGPAPTGAPLARVADVPVGGVLPVTGPGGTAAYLVRVDNARFVAFDRTCTHAGCQVELAPDQRTFACPCHLARFDARTGRVLDGPAPRPLDQVPIRLAGDEVFPDS